MSPNTSGAGDRPQHQLIGSDQRVQLTPQSGGGKRVQVTPKSGAGIKVKSAGIKAKKAPSWSTSTFTRQLSTAFADDSVDPLLEDDMEVSSNFNIKHVGSR